MKLEIRKDLCTRCGLCREECPSKAVRIDGKTADYSIYQPFCIACSHCAIICPVDAVAADEGEFPVWNKPDLNPKKLQEFIRGKRSIRRYRKEPVSKDFLENLLYTGSLTSTASNRQEWEATVLTGGAVRRVAGEVIEYYAGLMKLIKNPFMKLVLRFTEAKRYINSPETYERLVKFVEKFRKGGDPLFFHAPAVIILSASKKERRFGKTDCVLAGSAMMYTAAGFGIGSCMIGFAETAMNMSGSIKSAAGVDEKNRVHLVFTLGFADRPYKKLPIRNKMPATFKEN